MWFGSRRQLAVFLLAPLFRRIHGQSSNPGGASRIVSRTYRADAVILFLGVGIYHRAGVGGGQASLEESGEGASLRRTLFFGGGSDPKRARGLSRLGWIRETVTGPVGAPTAVDYFGVMTSSPEESLEHARKSVEGPASGRSVFSAANGRHTPGHSRSAVTHFEYSSSATWNDRGLIEHAQSTFKEAPWHETIWPNSLGQTPSTFLLELANLLKQRTRRAAGRYVYCEQEYTMELDTAASRDRERLLQVRAKVRNLKTGKETVFRIWLDETPDSLVPVRIEYQARSFLRLTFQAV
ncbi:MAG: hypothetical protein JWP63_6964 [Candidatus Solibacter sp.]|nr:hypothetical protein [Candidatus Solibacter sp.]